MALLATEKMINGFVVFVATGELSVTDATAGATVYDAFLRDPDGRLVVTSG